MAVVLAWLSKGASVLYKSLILSAAVAFLQTNEADVMRFEGVYTVPRCDSEVCCRSSRG
jgi:hypothetical protein